MKNMIDMPMEEIVQFFKDQKVPFAHADGKDLIWIPWTGVFQVTVDGVVIYAGMDLDVAVEIYNGPI